MKTPFDLAFDFLSGSGLSAAQSSRRRQAGGFALFGGPHILTLVTEVATRALKAVRYQKFNNHIRGRPEALAARIELLRYGTTDEFPADVTIPSEVNYGVKDMMTALVNNGTLAAVANLKNGQTNASGTYFLPMAFPEGSPMHPSYGAGHAAVAGACVTMLKAFFDTSTVLVEPKNLAKGAGSPAKFCRQTNNDTPVYFVAPPVRSSQNQLQKIYPCHPLTLEMELNKLAANISIGRNMAGVHFYSDYYDSLRMGEQIAIELLEEQAFAYPRDPFVMSLPTFDGDVIRIGRR